MEKNAIKERGKVLEGAFFGSQNARLLERLRNQLNREALSEASGINDEKALDALVKEGVTASTLTALTLVPLVFVAWADRLMNDKERKAVLSAALEAGIDAGSDSYQLIERWLTERPSSALRAAWERSIEATLAGLDESAKQELRHACLDRAEKVAKATGGFLGVATVSAVERETLQIVAKAFV